MDKNTEKELERLFTRVENLNIGFIQHFDGVIDEKLCKKLIKKFKEMDKKVSNTIVMNFVKPVIEKLSKDYYNHTKSTWVSFSKDTGDANSSVVQKNKFDAGMVDYIMELEQRI